MTVPTVTPEMIEAAFLLMAADNMLGAGRRTARELLRDIYTVMETKRLEQEAAARQARIRPLKFLIFAGAALFSIAMSAKAQSYGPYPEQTYLTCGSPAAKIAVVVIHGGWNSSGSNTETMPAKTCTFLGNRGVYAVNINYRLDTPGQSWPAQWQDAQLAVRWLRQTYKTVGIVGFSAGAYDTLGAALSQSTIIFAAADPLNEAALYPGTSSIPDFAVAVSPFSNLNDPALSAEPITKIVAGILPSGIDGITARAMASPVAIAHADIPRLLLIHGTADTVVPVEQSRVLASELQYLGAPVTYSENAGGHILGRLTAAQRLAQFQQITAFVKQQ